jgi:hypothetical protein
MRLLGDVAVGLVEYIARFCCPPFLSRSFLLQLAVLDLECSGYAPSLLAAAALSISLGVYGKPAWPQSLQCFGSYTEADLAPAKARLAELQASQVCWPMCVSGRCCASSEFAGTHVVQSSPLGAAIWFTPHMPSFCFAGGRAAASSVACCT